MSSEPPLSGRMRPLVAAELWVDGKVIAKVVFAWHWVRCRIKLTARITDVPKVRGALPDTCFQMHAHVPTDVDEFYLPALAWPRKINDVEVPEVATDVVSEIHTIGWVAASCPPVSGMSLQGSHSCQAQAVQIPILCVLVYWSVAGKGNIAERWQRTMHVSPRHHQGPRCTRLGLQITVCRVTVTSVVIEFIHATYGGPSR